MEVRSHDYDYEHAGLAPSGSAAPPDPSRRSETDSLIITGREEQQEEPSQQRFTCVYSRLASDKPTEGHHESHGSRPSVRSLV